MTVNSSPKMDCANMLESKICHFTSCQDIAYFLHSSDANTVQNITEKFVPAFEKLVNQAVRDTDLSNVAILVQVLHHLLKQNQESSIKMLISSKLHNKFGLLLGYAFDKLSTRNHATASGDHLYVMLLNVIIEYVKHMGDHCMWLFQNLLQKLLEILADRSVLHHLRSQTAELLLAVFSDDDREVIAFLRDRVVQDEAVFNSLCERMIQTLQHTGDFQLQECVLEVIFRMWSTEKRKDKAVKWLDGKQNLLSKFLAISYDKFDHDIRMFLNELNSSGQKRRILTLYYKELQVGSQILQPTNSWSNCVDFCYGNKVLDVRYPREELYGEHKCNFNINSIEGKDVMSFNVLENTSSRTIDLHLSFAALSCQVLNDFNLDDATASNLVIKLYRVTPLDASHIVKFVRSLFGDKYSESKTKKFMISKPKTMIFGNEPIPAQQSNQESVLNDSFVSMSQAHGVFQISQKDNLSGPVRHSQDVPGAIGRPENAVICATPSGQQHHRIFMPSSSSDERIPMPPKRAVSRPSSQHLSRGAFERPSSVSDSQRPSQVQQRRMMNNLAIHAIEDGMVNRPMDTIHGSASESSQVSQVFTPCSVPVSRIIVPGSLPQKRSDLKGQSSTSGPYGGLPCNAGSTSNSTIRKLAQPVVCYVRSAEPNTSKPHMIPTVKTAVTSTKKDRPVGHSKSTKAILCESSDFAKSDTDLTRVANSCRSHPLSGSHRSKPRKNSVSERNLRTWSLNSATDDSEDAFKKEKSSKSLNEITKETGCGVGMEWNEVIPETQAALNTSTKSADLMLGCLHGFEEPHQVEIPMKSQPDKKEETSPNSAESIHGKTASSEELGKKLNTPALSDASQCLKESTAVNPLVVEIFKTDSEAAKTTASEQDDLTRDSNNNKKSKKGGKLTLKSLNIDHSPEKAGDNAGEKRKNLRRSKRNRVELPLPFEELEDIPVIEDDNDFTLQPIETVRDAGPELPELNVLPSPEKLFPPAKRSIGRKLIMTDTTETSGQSDASKKKRHRVSFEDDIGVSEFKDGSSKKTTRKKSVRSKKARLFESTSTAASVESSELSWIKDHEAQQSATPKRLKTFVGKKKKSPPLPSMEKLTREEIWDGSTTSPSSPEVARSEAETTVMSEISRLQELGFSCNLLFDEILSEARQEEKQLKSKSDDDIGAVLPQSLAEVSQINVEEWNNNISIDEPCFSDFSPIRSDEIKLKSDSADGDGKPEKEAEISLIGTKDQNKAISVGGDGAYDKSATRYCLDKTSTEAKRAKLEPFGLRAAQSNNQTPIDTVDRMKIRTDTTRKPGKRKNAEKSPSDLQPEQTYFNSKRKLHMRDSESNLPSKSSVSASDSDGYPHDMKKILGKFVKQVDQHWNEGKQERDRCLEDFELQATEAERKHVQLIKCLNRHQKNIQAFMERSAKEGETLLRKAAENVVQTVKFHSNLREMMHNSNQEQDRKFQRLHHEIAKELRKKMRESMM